MRISPALFALSLVVPTTGVSAAILDGALVSEEYRTPDLNSPYPLTAYAPQSFVVGAGQESTIVLEGVTTFNVDFSDAALNLAFDTVLMNPDPTFNNNPFNGIVFTSTAFGDVASVTIGGTSNLVGFDNSRVSIVGDELRLNFAGLTYNTDTVVALDFTGNSGGVPEPGTWVMMLLGFGATGYALRSKRRRRSGLAQVA